MGGAKRQLEENEANRARAVEIAHKAGAIKICRHGTEIDAGDKEAAVNRARKVWQQHGFTSAKDAVQWVQRVVDEAGIECGHPDCDSQDMLD